MGQIDDAIDTYVAALNTKDLGPAMTLFAQRKVGGLLAQKGDARAATPWLTLAAEAGDPQSMSMLGNALCKQGMEARGMHWITRSAEAGDAHAMAMLGLKLLEQVQSGNASGGNLVQMADQSVHWLRAAVAAGYPEAERFVKTATAQRVLLSSGKISASEQKSCYIATAVYRITGSPRGAGVAEIPR